MNIEHAYRQIFGSGPAYPPVEGADEMLGELGEILDVIEEPLRQKVEGWLLQYALEQSMAGAFDRPQTKRRVPMSGIRKQRTAVVRRAHRAPGVEDRVSKLEAKIKQAQAILEKLYSGERGEHRDAAMAEEAEVAKIPVDVAKFCDEMAEAAGPEITTQLSHSFDGNGRLRVHAPEGYRFRLVAENGLVNLFRSFVPEKFIRSTINWTVKGLVQD